MESRFLDIKRKISREIQWEYFLAISNQNLFSNN